MSRRLWTGILLIVAAVAVSNYVPLLNQHAEQQLRVWTSVEC
jgi:hypothetical protein